jgi:hypothetical protein
MTGLVRSRGRLLGFLQKLEELLKISDREGRKSVGISGHGDLGVSVGGRVVVVEGWTEEVPDTIGNRWRDKGFRRFGARRWFVLNHARVEAM